MLQNLKSSIVLRLSVFFRLLISHLMPISASNSPNFLGHIPLSLFLCKYITYIVSPFCSNHPQLLTPCLLLHYCCLPAITCEAPTTLLLSNMSSVITCDSNFYVIPSQSQAIGILHAVGDGGEGSSNT